MKAWFTRAALIGSLAAAPAFAEGASTAAEVRADLAARVKAIPKDTWTVVGHPPWLFWSFELRHASHEKFWGPEAALVSNARADPDPLKAIVAYQRMLHDAGVEFLVVPIPSKLAIYGEQLVPPVNAELLDGTRAAFIAALRDKGVQVVDILPELRRIKASGQQAYLPRDTHWSPLAVRKVAAKLGKLVRGEKWYAAPDPKPEVSVEEVVESCHTDLATRRALETQRAFPAPDPIRIAQVRLGGRYVESDPSSPVVLLGDSFTVVFHDILAHHGGLADHLAAELGFPIDQVGMAGEGAIANGWATLARRMDNLAGKKLVILAFAERTLSVEPRGWPIIPVVRPAAVDGGAAAKP